MIVYVYVRVGGRMSTRKMPDLRVDTSLKAGLGGSGVEPPVQVDAKAPEADALLHLDVGRLSLVPEMCLVAQEGKGEQAESPTLQQWFQMTRTVKSCPASECGQSPDLSDVDHSIDTTADPYSGPLGSFISASVRMRFPTPDNSPLPQKPERTRLSSSAALFQPQFSQGPNAGSNLGYYAVPMSYVHGLQRNPWAWQVQTAYAYR